MPNGKLNGYFKWIAVLLSIGLSGTGAFFVLKTDVRVVEANVKALESRMEMQYQNILRELDAIKEMVR